LSDLVGTFEPPPSATATDGDSDDTSGDPDTVLLRGLVQGKTNREIADDLGLAEDEVAARLAHLIGAMGASSRAEATAMAFRQRVL
jgi:DNA-binding NarL/FixJ family response regulator